MKSFTTLILIFALNAFNSTKAVAQQRCDINKKVLNYENLILSHVADKDGFGFSTESLPISSHLFEAFSQLRGQSLTLEQLVIRAKARTANTNVTLVLLTGSQRYAYDAAPVPQSRNFESNHSDLFFEVKLPATGPRTNSQISQWFLEFEGEVKLSTIEFHLLPLNCEPQVAPPPIIHPPVQQFDQFMLECRDAGGTCLPFRVTYRGGRAIEKRQIGFNHPHVRLSFDTCVYLESKMDIERGVICSVDRGGYFRPFNVWSNSTQGIGTTGFGEWRNETSQRTMEDCVIAVQNIRNNLICVPFYNQQTHSWGYMRRDIQTNAPDWLFFRRLDDCAYSW